VRAEFLKTGPVPLVITQHATQKVHAGLAEPALRDTLPEVTLLYQLVEVLVCLLVGLCEPGVPKEQDHQHHSERKHVSLFCILAAAFADFRAIVESRAHLEVRALLAL